MQQTTLASFIDELQQIKTAAELTEKARDRIAPKNFAVKSKGQEKYPVEDKSHAANAMARVKQHGSPSEKSKVYSAVAKKFPELAAKSSVPAVKKKVAAEGTKKKHYNVPVSAGYGASLGAMYGGLIGEMKDKPNSQSKRDSTKPKLDHRGGEYDIADATGHRLKKLQDEKAETHRKGKAFEHEFLNKSRDTSAPSKFPLAKRDPKTPGQKPLSEVGKAKLKVKGKATEVAAAAKNLTKIPAQKWNSMSHGSRGAVKGALIGGALLGAAAHYGNKEKRKEAMPLSAFQTAAPAAKAAVKGALKPAAAIGAVQHQLNGAKSLLPGGAGPLQLWK